MIEQMQVLEWWDWSADKIREFLPYLMNGDLEKVKDVDIVAYPFTEMERVIEGVDKYVNTIYSCVKTMRKKYI